MEFDLKISKQLCCDVKIWFRLGGAIQVNVPLNYIVCTTGFPDCILSLHLGWLFCSVGGYSQTISLGLHSTCILSGLLQMRSFIFLSVKLLLCYLQQVVSWIQFDSRSRGAHKIKVNNERRTLHFWEKS